MDDWNDLAFNFAIIGVRLVEPFIFGNRYLSRWFAVLIHEFEDHRGVVFDGFVGDLQLIPEELRLMLPIVSVALQGGKVFDDGVDRLSDCFGVGLLDDVVSSAPSVEAFQCLDVFFHDLGVG